MWLINTSTFQLHHVVDSSEIMYAILSHRWQDEEVTFNDIQSLEKARAKKGFSKIEGCCAIAKQEGLEYAWVDTCCINKESSAELSEAINSMFRWYRDAIVCFAYLVDVNKTRSMEWRNHDMFASEWFQRGWTLQELLAPSNVVFYDQSWQSIGTKVSLSQLMADFTKIPLEVLEGSRSIFTYPVSQRMFWAAGRKTTRLEDRAYSLMGLFNVNMPMLYGEGQKAFLRLQEEIIKHSADHSIFAWTGICGTCSGLLAHSPDQFSLTSISPLGIENRGRHKYTTSVDEKFDTNPYEMTNLGLSIAFTMAPCFQSTYLALLDDITYDETDTTSSLNDILPGKLATSVAILLQYVGRQQYRRVAHPDLGDILHGKNGRGATIPFPSFGYKRCQVYVRQDELSSEIEHAQPISNLPFHGLQLAPIPGVDIDVVVSQNAIFYEDIGTIRLKPGHCSTIACIRLSHGNDPNIPIRAIKIGLSFDFLPLIAVQGSEPSAINLGLTDTADVRLRSFDSIDFFEESGWDTVDPSATELFEARRNLHIYRCPNDNWPLPVRLMYATPSSSRYRPEIRVQRMRNSFCEIHFNVYSESMQPGSWRFRH